MNPTLQGVLELVIGVVLILLAYRFGHLRGRDPNRKPTREELDQFVTGTHYGTAEGIRRAMQERLEELLPYWVTGSVTLENGPPPGTVHARVELVVDADDEEIQ
jgi:hypothetical protein